METIVFEQHNKLIAEFMGTDNAVPYHSDWNCLMEVVDKIEKTSYRIGRHFYLKKTSSYVQFKVDRMENSTESLSLGKWGTCGNTITKEAIYNACLEFIRL